MLVAAVVVLAVVVALLVLLVTGLLRSHADILRALHELGASLDDDGTAAPSRTARQLPPTFTGAAGRTAAAVVGSDPLGSPVATSVDGGRDTLLVFLSSGCTTCQPFWGALRGGEAGPADTNVLVVTRDPDEESTARIADLAGDRVPVVMSTQAWEDYEIPGSPHVVLVDGGTGTVRGEGAAGTWPQVLDLVGQARGDRAHARSWLPDPVTARDNADRIDAELAAHGIGDGHASLYPGRP